MAYYHDIITEKSWKALQDLRRKHQFVLIGGWAVWLYTKALKSRDIDFICDYEELQKLKSEFDLVKNDRLKKYEIHMGEFDVDIYVPFYSELGIPVEDLQKMARSVDGIQVLAAEALLVLKQNAYLDRAGSAKGEKDKIDIISLLGAVQFAFYKNLLKKYGFENLKSDLKNLLLNVREIPELNISAHAFARMKKKVWAELS